MMKRMFAFLLCAIFVLPAAAQDDPFAFVDMAAPVADIPNGVIADAPDIGFLPAVDASINRGAKLADVLDFDIAGVLLRMPFEDVQTLFFKLNNLYEPIAKGSIVYIVPRDWKNNLDYECRQQKIAAPAALETCINSLARNRGLLYPAEIHLRRAPTGETLDIYFTSNASDNRVWRVVYKNDVNEIEGSAEKFADQRDKKILAFWQDVLDKYGAPNAGSDKWMSSDNVFDPMMTAYYGELDLMAHGDYAADEAKNAKMAAENFKAKPYAF